jgi:hypothetical protein
MVLIPCRPATFDLEAIATTLMLAKAAGKPSFVVLHAVPPRSPIVKEAADGLKQQGAQVAPCVLTHPCRFQPWRDRWPNRAGIRAGWEGRTGDRSALQVAMRDCRHVHT